MRRRIRKKRLITVTIVAAIAVVAIIFLFQWAPWSKTEEPETAREPTLAELMDVSNVSLNGKKVIIDAGHGGFDPGSTGSFTGREEKEINLEFAKMLEEKLTAQGVEVIMTRSTDDALAASKEEDMEMRKQIILDSDADMFISIHQNIFEEDSSKSGPQVFYAYHGTEGKKLATAVQDMLNYELGIEDPRMALNVPYDVLKPGSQPSCTIECGFLTNEEEEKKLQTPEYQDEFTDSIIHGMKLYLKRAEETEAEGASAEGAISQTSGEASGASAQV